MGIQQILLRKQLHKIFRRPKEQDLGFQIPGTCSF